MPCPRDGRTEPRVARFQWGWFGDLLGTAPGPIESFAPMMLFAVLFGLSMDYEVFLLSRVREEYQRTDDAETAVAIPRQESDGARVLALVETRLLQLGYGNIQVLTDLSHVRADGDVEVQVECERGSMPTKGRVQLRNGAVRDVALQTVAQMFP